MLWLDTPFNYLALASNEYWVIWWQCNLFLLHGGRGGVWTRELNFVSFCDKSMADLKYNWRIWFVTLSGRSSVLNFEMSRLWSWCFETQLTRAFPRLFVKLKAQLTWRFLKDRRNSTAKLRQTCGSRSIQRTYCWHFQVAEAENATKPVKQISFLYWLNFRWFLREECHCRFLFALSG